jgi:tetratricopeptide (TPR) repeat protein
VSNTLGKAAEWFARNGHPAEAMEFGQIGARSYSFAGLVGLAEALAVNGEYEEAKRVFEAVTKRYRYSGDDRVGFLLHYGTTPEEVAQVTREIMRTRPDIADQEAQRATGAILAHAPDKTYYEALGEDILGEIKPLRRQILEAMFAMQQRRFEDVLTFTRRLLDDKKDTYDPDARMLRLHALRLLGRDADAREHATTMLEEATGAKPMVEYVLGRIDAETFKTRSTGLEPTNHYHFTMGVDAELAGRIDEAQAHYAKADTARWQGEVMQYWARQMARETQAEGKAAEPAPTE